MYEVLSNVFTPYATSFIYQQYIKWNNYTVQADQLVHGVIYYVQSNMNSILLAAWLFVICLDRMAQENIHQVRLDNSGKLYCTCSMLSTRGFPCRHMWKVNCYLDRNDLVLIRIIPRWTIDYGIHFLRAIGISSKFESFKLEQSSEEKKFDVSEEKEEKFSQIMLNPVLPQKGGEEKSPNTPSI